MSKPIGLATSILVSVVCKIIMAKLTLYLFDQWFFRCTFETSHKRAMFIVYNENLKK
jgi:hypothetical protein